VVVTPVSYSRNNPIVAAELLSVALKLGIRFQLMPGSRCGRDIRYSDTFSLGIFSVVWHVSSTLHPDLE
jgi:hypothetical protein